MQKHKLKTFWFKNIFKTAYEKSSKRSTKNSYSAKNVLQLISHVSTDIHFNKTD